MSEGMPSMTALLGLLAIAGYQNRDKIAEMLGGGHAAPAGSAPAATPLTPQGAGGSFLNGLGGVGAGGLLSGGLGRLVDQFKQNGHGPIAHSWVDSGPNQPIAPQQLEQAIGPDVLAQLTQSTGLSREDLLTRLSTTLPHAVDRYTPGGRLPAPT